MPLAGGVLGLNVWVENGDACFLLASPNCMDENGMQTKLGLIRLHFTPSILEKNFRQHLRLASGDILITGESPSGAAASVTLWCAVNHPVVHAQVDASEPVQVTATYETWAKYEAKTAHGALLWVRRLPDPNPRRLRDIKAQGVEEFAKFVPDPLSGLTMGGRIDAPNLIDAGTGQSKFNNMPTRTCAVKAAAPVRRLDLCVTLRMEQDTSVTQWESRLAQDAQRAQREVTANGNAALAWWKDFWNRSHIAINGGAEEKDAGWLTGRNYQLFRYELAANRGGRMMTLFNGGVFNCQGNPDHRQWDFCQFMAQNERLIYWPMLKSGDDDLLKVAMDFYRDRAEIRRLHYRKFFGVDGLVYPEPLNVFGLDSLGTDAQGRDAQSHLHYHYTSCMEFALMMIDYGRFTGRDITPYLPVPEGIIQYYDQYYQKTHKKKNRSPARRRGPPRDLPQRCARGISRVRQ